MGAASWSYQALKLRGGLLSGGAAFIGGAFDIFDYAKNKDKGYNWLSTLLLVKGGIGFASGLTTFGVAYTYSAPLVTRLAGRGLAGTLVKAAGRRAAAFVAIRILGMATGGWITVGLFGVQVIVWWIMPNALEEWIDHSAFGNKRAISGFRTAKEQDKILHDALVEMGLR